MNLLDGQLGEQGVIPNVWDLGLMMDAAFRLMDDVFNVLLSLGA